MSLLSSVGASLSMKQNICVSSSESALAPRPSGSTILLTNKLGKLRKLGSRELLLRWLLLEVLEVLLLLEILLWLEVFKVLESLLLWLSLLLLLLEVLESLLLLRPLHWSAPPCVWVHLTRSWVTITIDHQAHHYNQHQDHWLTEILLPCSHDHHLHHHQDHDRTTENKITWLTEILRPCWLRGSSVLTLDLCLCRLFNSN